MKGVIVAIKENEYGQEFGFIRANDTSYYFDSRNLTEGMMADFYVGDPVEFEPQVHSYDPTKKKATNVRLDLSSVSMSQSSISAFEDAPSSDHSEEETLQKKTGYITNYYSEKGFGFIDGKLFFHISNVLNPEQFSFDTKNKKYKVLFDETESFRKKGELCATQITVLEEVDKKAASAETTTQIENKEVVSSTSVSSKQTGYIILYMQQRKCGYIISEAEYGKSKRGDIYFEATDIQNEQILNTFENHYLVSYTLIDGAQKHAVDIIVLDVLPQYDNAKQSILPARAEDIAKFDFVAGETLVIKSHSQGRLVGQFLSRDNAGICIKTASQDIYVAVNEISELQFCGLITSFDVLSSTGRINNTYTFRISNVVNKQLVHLLKLSRHTDYLCLYSLMIDGNTRYISSVDYFSKDICSQLPWNYGRIHGIYKRDAYFSIEKEYRCYESTVNDDAILSNLNNNDFLQQEVFYKFIVHPTVDMRRRGKLSYSVIDVRSKYQLGKILCYPNSPKKDIQCGAQVYSSETDLSDYPVGKPVKAELLCEGFDKVFVTSVDRSNLQLPSYADELQREKSIFDAKVRQADFDGDYLLQIQLNEELLEKAFIYPELAIGTIFQICVRQNELERMVSILERYGYLLENDSYHGFRMQLDMLTGDISSAIGHARKYLATAQKDELLESFASIIQQRAVSPETLREHILNKQPFDAVRNTGKIGLYDTPTKCGYITWERGKLNFSYKDIIDYDGSDFDLSTYDYFVSFEIDRSKHIPKASNVCIYETTPKSASTESLADDDVNVFNADDFIGDVRVTTLLEFRRDTFAIGGTIGYLEPKVRKKFQGEEFTGTLTEARTLITALRHYYEKNSPYRTAPASQKPNFLLAAAFIHQQICDKEKSEDAFWSQDTANELLFEYAFRYLSTDSATEIAEVEYYCESVFLNQFPDTVKNRMKARCLAKYFEGTERIKLDRCAERNAIIGILKRKCINILGLAKMFLNLPEQILDELLSCTPKELLQVVAEMIATMNNDEFPDANAEGTTKRYHKIYCSAWEEFRKQLNSLSAIDDTPYYLELLESAENRIGKYLFDSDQSRLANTIQIVNVLANNLYEEDIDVKISQLQSLFGNIRNVINQIEAHPSRFSFEALRPFLLKTCELLSAYLDKQYALFAPVLTVEHHSLSGDGMREILSVSNERNHLPAVNVKISNIMPYGANPGYIIDTDGNRIIQGAGQTINGGKAIEVSIPIRISPTAGDMLELSLDISYERSHQFNELLGYTEHLEERLDGQKIQIPRKLEGMNPPQENKYRSFAGGDIMKPDNESARQMFYGRDKDIASIYQMIRNADGSLKRGSITAFYGQKRCGKSSVMYFLAKKIQEEYPRAIVIDINADSFGVGEKKSTYLSTFLSRICAKFKTATLLSKELRAILKEYDLSIPSTAEIHSEGGDAYFQDFFQMFQTICPEYPIVLMVDEFTKVYVHMKKHAIQEDFLNRWRALIQDNGFVNIVVGQDFMDKFTTDEDITSQNFGGAVNGLGTMNKKRLSYLEQEAAREMIEDPVRFADGSSRYRGLLGEEAISRIYELTGGSAFYLMKFCNALVDYMIDHGECFVSKGLVETVAGGYVFDTQNNPINKTDFDPIFNEYSYREDATESDSTEVISNYIKEETLNTYRLLKQIADNANNKGICNIDKIQWHNRAEKNRILKSLMIRGVLVDHQGRGITAERIDRLDVKIKVGLFSVWLRKRG